MGYDRKVRYLDYYESGQRVRGCGFAKLELWEENLRLELALRGIEGMDGQQREVMLCAGGKEYAIGRISIVRGTGEFRSEGKLAGQSEMPDGICIHLSADREISGRWQNNGKAAGMVKPIAAAGERNAQTEGAGTAEKMTQQEELGTAEREDNGVQTKSSAGEERAKPQDSVSIRLMEDKWLQICSIYPHVCPFQDEREYLSIGPADFVLFPAASYRQANNSFLLHGFYNYKHLILTRVERRGEIIYYIGVPGNFYEREKQVALMFGFESFECAEEPAQNGDFGYYMMRTEL